MTKLDTLESVSAALRDGEKLVLVSSAMGGGCWHLEPSLREVEMGAAELVVQQDFVVTDDDQVGRLYWVFRDRMACDEANSDASINKSPFIAPPRARLSKAERDARRASRRLERELAREEGRRIGPVPI